MKAVKHIFLSLVIISFCACGGGTTGTGTYSRSFSGTLQDTEGKPLSNFQVTILETGDSVETDSEGKFLIDSILDNRRATFLVEGETLNNQVEISDLPEEEGLIEINLEGDSDSNTIILLSIEVIALQTATPTPTPVEIPTETPTEDKSTPEPTPILNNIYKGSVVDENNKSISGVKITLVNFNKSKLTDTSGSFELTSKPGKNKVSVKVEYKGSSKTFEISVPKKSVKVVMQIEIITKSGGIGTSSTDSDFSLDVNLKDRA